MLLVSALLSKNPRFIKSTTTKNGYQAVFSHSLLLNENTYVIQYYKIKLLLKFNVPEIFQVYRCIVSTWEWVHHKPEAIHYILTLLDDSKEGI